MNEARDKKHKNPHETISCVRLWTPTAVFDPMPCCQAPACRRNWQTTARDNQEHYYSEYLAASKILTLQPQRYVISRLCVPPSTLGTEMFKDFYNLFQQFRAKHSKLQAF